MFSVLLIWLFLWLMSIAWSVYLFRWVALRLDAATQAQLAVNIEIGKLLQEQLNWNSTVRQSLHAINDSIDRIEEYLGIDDDGREVN
jgi:cell division protein FtsL